MKDIVIVFMVNLILVSTLTLALNIQPVEAAGTIYILADGSIDPPGASISTVDNVTYTLTGNILSEVDGIVVRRSNVIINGAGYTLQGAGSSNGFSWSNEHNVTIKYTRITNFKNGIMFSSSSNNTISGNTITTNIYYGLFLYSSSTNSISSNNIVDNNHGLQLYYHSDLNSIIGNTIEINKNRGVGLDFSSDNTISGNTITDNGQGIMLKTHSDSNSISSNNVTANLWGGISLAYNSVANTISGNEITANSEDGIELSSSSSNIISGNTIVNNSRGIGLELSSYNEILSNDIVANALAGLRIDYSSSNTISGNRFTDGGLRVTSSYQNSIENNTVNGKPLVYLEGVANDTVDDAGQVILVRCENITVENLNLSGASVGVELWETDNSTISSNTIAANTLDGIELSFSSGNTISGNTILDNINGIKLETYSEFNTISGNNITLNSRGIWILSSSCNTISNNNITANYYSGLWMSSSTGNRVFHNNFINNTSPLYSSNSVNTWDDGYPSGGNHWSDYTAEDAYCGQQQDLSGSDGMGDTPRTFDDLNQDSYPLIEPWSWASHDVAVATIIPRNVVGQGYTTYPNVTVINYGTDTETFNITIHANATLIAITNVALSSKSSNTITFTWNTTDFPLGNYTLTAHATPVFSEAYTVDNTFVYGWVTVIHILGDMDSDYDVDIFDIVRIATIYGVVKPDPAYDPNCDIDGDGDIDIFDIVAAASHYGESW